MDEIEKLIEEEELGEAQRKLNEVKEKNARWHFLQGKLYLSKKWYFEARKEFKAAVKTADASDERTDEYKAALQDLEDFSKTPEYKQYKLERFGEGFCEACCASCGLC